MKLTGENWIIFLRSKRENWRKDRTKWKPCKMKVWMDKVDSCLNYCIIIKNMDIWNLVWNILMFQSNSNPLLKTTFASPTKKKSYVFLKVFFCLIVWRKKELMKGFNKKWKKGKYKIYVQPAKMTVTQLVNSAKSTNAQRQAWLAAVLNAIRAWKQNDRVKICIFCMFFR